ncbi:tetratricopeptide repeat protein 14-like isoform X2 [Panonychus citri]|uniref:tetratricopeptide repeat protein 14-like isoform X2 n=1 Tax=Panonychus citri TaxID=50023 RepID=UPI002307B1D3|nr:tetratricopeptide repeat protein 14-like isoform X2 [Panonychus citri]
MVDPIRSRLTRFAQRSKEMVENQKKLIHKQVRQLVSEKMEEEICACLPPIETFTGVSKVCRRKHFYESLVKGDILCVEVTAHAESCLICTVLCMDGGKRRDIHDCEVKAYCPSINCLPPTGSNSEDGYQPKDTLRVVVVGYNDYDLKIIVSMKEEHLPKELKKNFKMGPINDDDLPIHFRRQIVMKKFDYNEMLQATLSFNNPGASLYLAQFFELPISQRFSFLRDFHNVTYPEDEYFKHLRKVQSAENARQSVEDGVNFLKAGSYLESQQCLNKALQMDSDNIDALVARGCLYANTNSLIKAAEDFDKALSIDPEHINARKYMSETLQEMGKLFEEKGDYDNALRSYRRSCQVNVKNNEALETLKSLIEKRGTQRSRSTQDELKNMYKDLKEKSYYETSHKLTLLLEEDKKGRQSRRNRSSSSSSSSSDSSISSTDSSSSSANSDSSSDGSKRRSRRKKKSKKSKSKKSKRRKEKKKRRGSRDSIRPIPGIRIEKSVEPSKDKKSNETVSRNTPKRPSPRISFTIKKNEPEIRTIKLTKPFSASSSKASPPKRNPTTEKIVYNLDKLKPVSIEFVRNGPIDKPVESKPLARSPPRTRSPRRSFGRLYIPRRSRSRTRSRSRSPSRRRSPARGRWRRSRSRGRSRSRSRGRSRSRSRPRAICRAILSPRRPRGRSRSPRRPRRSPSKERSKRPSPSRNSDKTAKTATLTKTVDEAIKKVTEEAKKLDAVLKDQTSVTKTN